MISWHYSSHAGSLVGGAFSLSLCEYFNLNGSIMMESGPARQLRLLRRPQLKGRTRPLEDLGSWNLGSSWSSCLSGPSASARTSGVPAVNKKISIITTLKWLQLIRNFNINYKSATIILLGMKLQSKWVQTLILSYLSLSPSCDLTWTLVTCRLSSLLKLKHKWDNSTRTRRVLDIRRTQ